MTIAQAIQRFDNQRVNGTSFELKVQWLSQLDYKIWAEILEPRGTERFEGYTLETPQNKELFAPDTYGELYIYWLNMMLDYVNAEISRFNNSNLMFNRLYKEYCDYVNRTTPIPQNNTIKAGDLIV